MKPTSITALHIFFFMANTDPLVAPLLATPIVILIPGTLPTLLVFDSAPAKAHTFGSCPNRTFEEATLRPRDPANRQNSGLDC